jgi:hypothetical protein
VVGFSTLQQPVLAVESLTLVLAAAFVVGGVFRIIVALVERFPSWGWVLANGVITVLLGIAIWRQWPASGLWVIGMFVGIDLVVNGVTWSLQRTSRDRGEPLSRLGQHFPPPCRGRVRLPRSEILGSHSTLLSANEQYAAGFRDEAAVAAGSAALGGHQCTGK